MSSVIVVLPMIYSRQMCFLTVVFYLLTICFSSVKCLFISLPIFLLVYLSFSCQFVRILVNSEYQSFASCMGCEHLSPVCGLGSFVMVSIPLSNCTKVPIMSGRTHHHFWQHIRSNPRLLCWYCQGVWCFHSGSSFSHWLEHTLLEK